MKKLIFITMPLLLGAVCLFPACKGNSDGSAADSTAVMTAKNKQTALASLVAASKHDIDAMFKDCSPDYIDNGAGIGSKPMKLDSAKASFKAFLASFPDLHADNLVALAQGDTVVVLGTWTGTFKAAMDKMSPTGKAFKVFDEDILTFNKDGKIASHQSIIPNSVYIEQVSAVMPPSK